MVKFYAPAIRTSKTIDLKTRNRNRALRARDNDNDSLIPEFWAQESLAILEENMVIGNLVRRDFNDMVAKMGSTVHVSRPSRLTGQRKTDSDSVTIQDVSSMDVPVVLNQHVHTAFMIKDGEESMAIKSLVELYMQPAMLGNAEFVDRCLYGRIGQFLSNCGGQLGQLTKVNAQDYILDTRRILNNNLCPIDGRNAIVTSNSETAMLKTDLFIQAQQVGDQGEALRNASLGRKLGFDFYMAQNASSISSGPVVVTGAINAGNLAVGSTSFTVDGLSAAIPANSWITIAGDNTPLRVVSTAGGSTPVTIVTSKPIRAAILDNAVVTVYKPAVTGSTTYPVKYAQELAVTFSPNTNLQVGQLVTFTNTTPADETVNPIYSIIAVTSTGITLDRPLEVQVANGSNVNGGPVGEYNLFFRRDALALVTRPLASPANKLALAANVSYNNLAMRAVITYNGEKQGHLVVLDMLLGTAMLDENQGAVLLG